MSAAIDDHTVEEGVSSIHAMIQAFSKSPFCLNEECVDLNGRTVNHLEASSRLVDCNH